MNYCINVKKRKQILHLGIIFLHLGNFSLFKGKKSLIIKNEEED
jgi:hypothetical protein